VDRSSNETGRKKMDQAIRLRERREETWQREGERSIWQNLSMLGVLGWLIVTPILIGIAIGRWLDNLYGTDVFFSGSLIFLGCVVGGYLAWQRMHKD